MPTTPPTNDQRRAFLLALYERVGDHAADGKTTVLDFVRADMGWDEALFGAVAEAMVKGGLMTAPTRTGVVGLTDVGLAVARRRKFGPEVDDEDDED